MPHVLINKLNKLMDMRFPNQRKVGGDPYLSCYRSDLPDEVLDAIDQITMTARNTFGSKIQPDARQSAIMRERGFPVQAGKVVLGVWHTGVIETPKGLITYK